MSFSRVFVIKSLLLSVFSFSAAAQLVVPSALKEQQREPKQVFTCEINTLVQYGEVTPQEDQWFMMPVDNLRKNNAISFILIRADHTVDPSVIEVKAAKICQKRLAKQVSRHCQSFRVQKNRIEKLPHFHLPPNLERARRFTVKPYMTTSTARLYRKDMRGHGWGEDGSHLSYMQIPFQLESPDQPIHGPGAQEILNESSQCDPEGNRIPMPEYR